MSQFYALIADYNNLLILLGIAVGYLCKGVPIYPKAYIQEGILLVELVASPWFIHPVPLALVKGIIYTAFACLSYDMIIARIEDYLAKYFDTFKVIANLGKPIQPTP